MKTQPLQLWEFLPAMSRWAAKGHVYVMRVGPGDLEAEQIPAWMIQTRGDA